MLNSAKWLTIYGFSLRLAFTIHCILTSYGYGFAHPAIYDFICVFLHFEIDLQLSMHVFVFLVEQECCSYMETSVCRPGFIHTIHCSHLYGDVLSLFADDKPTEKYPLSIKFADERAVDCGGVARDMFSGFWEKNCQESF